MVYQDLYGVLAKADAGAAHVTTGTLDDAQPFFSYFDAPATDPITLASR